VPSPEAVVCIPNKTTTMMGPRVPSQLHWSDFENRHSSTISELWPPYNFDGSTTTDSRVRSSSEWVSTRGSDTQATSTIVSDRTASIPKHESQTTRSLRRFVEDEIGLDAIHSGMSEDVFDVFPDQHQSRIAGLDGRQALKYRNRNANLKDGFDEPSIECEHERKAKRSVSSVVYDIFHGDDGDRTMRRTRPKKAKKTGCMRISFGKFFGSVLRIGRRGL
jgi:hypothetical protein